MADSNEDRDERQLPASERKLRKAREDGQVPRSREFGHAAAWIAWMALLVMYGPTFAQRTLDWFGAALRLPVAAMRRPEQGLDFVARLGAEALLSALPWLIVPIVATVAVSLALGGWVWTSKLLAPDLTRLDPMRGLKRMVSGEALLQLLKVVLLAAVLLAVGAWQASARLDQMAQYGAFALPAALLHAATDLKTALWPVLGVLIALALVDGPMQWFLFRRRMRMTRQEAKEEFKESEGDPHIKGRIRAKQRALAQRRMLTEVPTADVVVTNPTHFAVALNYKDGVMAAPRVVAKGADLWAARIRDLAQEHRVPILEAPPLARALYRHVEVDQEIPADLYAAVAQVLAWVYQLSLYESGRAVPPQKPSVVLPPGLDPQERA